VVFPLAAQIFRSPLLTLHAGPQPVLFLVSLPSPLRIACRLLAGRFPNLLAAGFLFFFFFFFFF